MGRLTLEKYYPHLAGLVLLFVFVWKPQATASQAMLFFVISLAAYIVIAMWVIAIDLWVGLFVAACFLSFLFMGGSPYNATYWRTLAIWFLYVAMRVRDTETLKDWLCVALLFHCALVIIQSKWGLPWIIDNRTNKPAIDSTGVLFNRDASSALIAVCAFAMCRKWWKYLLPIPAIALVCTHAYTGVFGILAGGFYFIYRKWGRRILLASVIPCLACGFSYAWFVDKPDISTRLYLWQCIYEQHLGSLPLGIGLGNFSVDVPKHNVFGERQAHNELIHYTVELGIVLPIIFLGWLVSTFKKVQAVTGAALIACIAASMAYFVLHDAIIAFACTTWAAIAVVERRVAA